MRRRVCAAVLVAFAAALSSTASNAESVEPTGQGWWWIGRTSAPALLAAPPYVPPDGLYVASDPFGDEAIAALRYQVPPGALLSTVSLKVSGVPIGSLEIGLCLATDEWSPVQGGSWADRPTFDCTSAVEGTLSDDASQVTFPTAPLVRAGVLDVVVVALAPSTGTRPAFQVAFEKPRQSARLDAAAPTAATTTTAVAAPSTVTTSAPSHVEPPPLDELAPSSSASAPPVEPTQLSATPANESPKPASLRVLGVVGLAAVSVVTWRLRTRPPRPPRLIIALAGRPHHGDLEGSGAS